MFVCGLRRIASDMKCSYILFNGSCEKAINFEINDKQA